MEEVMVGPITPSDWYLILQKWRSQELSPLACCVCKAWSPTRRGGTEPELWYWELSLHECSFGIGDEDLRPVPSTHMGIQADHPDPSVHFPNPRFLILYVYLIQRAQSLKTQGSPCQSFLQWSNDHSSTQSWKQSLVILWVIICNMIYLNQKVIDYPC